MTRLRRILISFAVLAVFAVAGFGTAFASADDGPRFTLPERRIGDRVLYEGDLLAQVSFDGVHNVTVGQPRLWRDIDGTWHRGDVLETSIGSISLLGMDLPFIMASVVDGESWAPLAAARSSTSGGSSSSGGPFGGSSSEYSQTFHMTPGITNHPCGILNSLQGTDTWAARITVGGDCHEGGPVPFQFQRSSEWQGSPAMVYKGDVLPEWYDGIKVIELTFAAGIPYPVLIDYKVSGESVLTSTLVGFDRGQKPVRFPAELPMDGALPGVGEVDVDRYGPDLEGLDATYPLQDMFEAARTAADFSDLRDFIAAHPDWRISYAKMEMEGDKISWVFNVGDESEGLFVFARASPAAESVLPMLPSATWSHSFSSLGGWDAQSLDELAPTAPSARDVAAAWQAYAATMDAPNQVGFSTIGCRPSCGRMTVAVGEHPYLPEEDGGLLGLNQPARKMEAEAFRLEYDRSEVESIEWETTQIESSGGPFAEPRPAAVGDYEAEGVFLPAPPAAAGLGAGLLLAVTYYFWPGVKALPGLGLFTRLKEPDLLQHPKRRRITKVIETSPGIHFKELQRRTELANGTLRHHVQHLVAAGFIQERRARGFTCFYPGKTIPAATAVAAPLLKAKGAREIFDVIRASPSITIAELAGATGLAKGTIGYHLKRLRAAGLVQATQQQRILHLELTKSGTLAT